MFLQCLSNDGVHGAFITKIIAVNHKIIQGML